MNKYSGKMVRAGIALLAISLLFGVIRETAAAEGSGGSKSAESPAERDSSLLVLQSIEVYPAKPGPETLCKLRVRVHNKGGQAATYFVFSVRINGQEVSIYRKHVFVQTIAAGEVRDIQLYNFWTAELARPVPKDGQLRVEVRLREARWVEVKTDGNVTEYKTLGNVEGLPIKVERAIALGPADRR